MAVKKLKKQSHTIKKQKWRPKLKNNNNDTVQQSNVIKSTKKKTLVIAQEIKFARTLASNDKKARAKMLKNLRSWLTVRSKSSFKFSEPEFMRLWKGLYYCMWLSDKPLVQEELAESISHLIFCFDSLDVVLMYIKCTLKTLSYEWFGIDHYRMDKFEMLVRRIIRQIFVMCKKQLWNEQWIIGVANAIETTLIDLKGSLGFKFHVTEVYMEELAKVSGGLMPEELVTELLRPFAIYLATMTDGRQISHVTKHIFRYLIFQSDVGMEYMEKFNAWKRAGFPTGRIDAMEKVEVSNDEENNEIDEEQFNDKVKEDRPLDPRAGSVHVDLPQLPFNAQQISELIQQYKFHPLSTKKNRQQIARLINEFDELAKGIMPLGIKKIKIPQAKSADTNPKIAAMRLIEFEDELYADTNRNLNRKKKKKLLATENADDDVLNGSNKKKLKLELPIIDNSNCENENEYSDEEIVQDEEIESPPVNIQPDKLKKKSLQKEFKLKNKKTKTKKLKDFKEIIQNELLDGIDDFENFKNTKVIFDKKKKVKYDFNNSWEISSSESSPVVTIENKSKISSVTSSPSAMEKSKEKKSKSMETTPADKILRLQPIVKNLNIEKPPQKTPTVSPVIQTVDSNLKKRVKIVLQRNTTQATSEYFRQLRLSPAIPYDANKKPPVGVLKSTPISSPLNPFYKKM